MADRERVVVDTNVLVSRLLLPRTTAGRAVQLAVDQHQLLVSEATLDELADVLSRPKFDSYVSAEDRQTFFRLLLRIAEIVSISTPVRVCRDPADDKFLELAVSGEASWIVTGDQDLLVLNPFRDIHVAAPSEFLEHIPK
ncbi:MAG TPA: putative toxin-antitoxin system toxin component, PIN family [Burkholderiales bacterium]|nr:putative toxin-antitoxin system toxin component, PIN family [Burkholderiales bacterium]